MKLISIQNDFSCVLTKVFSAFFLFTLVCSNASTIDCSQDGGGSGIKLSFSAGSHALVSAVEICKQE